MTEKLLAANVQDFILAHENADEHSLILQHKHILGLAAPLVAEQISGRRKAKLKLPHWYATPGILYPPGLNMEQSSSEATAEFKVSLLKRFFSSASVGADLTGGLGVDAYHLSALFQNFHYVEKSVELVELAKNNHHALKCASINYHHQKAEEFLGQVNTDFLYLDPSRRSQGKKVVLLEDCTPNVVELQHQLFNHSRYVLIKTSPLLDIQQALRQLKYVKIVVVLAHQDECKELLFLCEKDFNQEPVIEAVNLDKEGRTVESFSFYLSDERKAASSFGDLSTYLYEPNAAILKAGAFRLIGERYELQKLHVNTHFYTSDQLFNGFPGRIFEVICPADVKSIAHNLNGFANIITRNYPLAPDQLKKKFKLKDGGNKYLIGFSGKEKKGLVIAQRVK